LAVNFPNIQSIVSEDDVKLDNLELTLMSLTFVDPKNNYKLIQYKLIPIFKIISDLEKELVGEKLENDPIFQFELIMLLLEKSIDHHKEYLELDDEVSKETKKQDSRSLAIKSHLLLNQLTIVMVNENFEPDFTELFLSYEHDIDKVPILEQQIIKKIKVIISKNNSLEENTTSKLPTNPTIFLSTSKYTDDNYLVILEGMNFNENQIIVIEYVSPYSNEKKIIEWKTTSDGVIYFPFEFTQDLSKSYTFSIIAGEIELSESLVPSIK